MERLGITMPLDCTAQLSPCKGRLTSFCYGDDDDDDDDDKKLSDKSRLK